MSIDRLVEVLREFCRVRDAYDISLKINFKPKYYPYLVRIHEMMMWSEDYERLKKKIEDAGFKISKIVADENTLVLVLEEKGKSKELEFIEIE